MPHQFIVADRVRGRLLLRHASDPGHVHLRQLLPGQLDVTDRLRGGLLLRHACDAGPMYVRQLLPCGLDVADDVHRGQLLSRGVILADGLRRRHVQFIDRGQLQRSLPVLPGR